MSIVVIWFVIIFIIFPIAGEWDSIKSLYGLFKYKTDVYWNGDKYKKFVIDVEHKDIVIPIIYEYKKGVFVGNSSFRFDKPKGVSALFPPLWIIWWAVTWKLKDI